MIGLGNFAEGFKNLLIYCHLNLINPKFNNEFARTISISTYIQDSYKIKNNFVSSNLMIPNNIFKEFEFEK